jgi:glycosyltransferase involved in cell wall biosynthesis
MTTSNSPDSHSTATPALSVAAPVFNEEGNLLPLAHGLGPILDSLVGKGRWEFVLVDNGSRDGTRKEIETVKGIYPDTHYIYLKRPNIGEAQNAGLMAVRAPWCLLIQADWWDALFTVWAWTNREKYDYMFGSKRLDPSLDRRSRDRHILSWGLNALLRLLTGYQGSDTHGPRLMRMEVMRPIFESCTMRRGQYDTEFTIRAHRAGLRIAEFPVGVKEVRMRRNRMLKKILQNTLDLCRITYKLGKVPNMRPSCFDQYRREDAREAKNLLERIQTGK